jgi:hypothetical protein
VTLYNDQRQAISNSAAEDVWRYAKLASGSTLLEERVTAFRTDVAHTSPSSISNPLAGHSALIAQTGREGMGLVHQTSDMLLLGHTPRVLDTIGQPHRNRPSANLNQILVAFWQLKEPCFVQMKWTGHDSSILHRTKSSCYMTKNDHPNRQ